MRPCTHLCFVLLIVGSLLMGSGCSTSDTPNDDENDDNSQTMSLSVTVTGSGSIDSDPAGIQCGQQCQYDFPSEGLVTLTATPEQGYELEGWGGACSGSDSTCQLELTEDREVTASFAIQENEDPCMGVSCSDHGSCDAGTCICEAGYAGTDCSDCEDGYILSGDDCVLDTSSVPLEGYGTTSSFGEAAGYETCTVSNLNDSGAGSLRDCIINRNGTTAAPIPRKVVFTVGGTITLASDIILRQPDLTIDGLSAPNPGITIAKTGDGTDGEFRVATWPNEQTCAHDVLIQGLRFAGVWDTTSESHDQNAVTIGIDGEDYPNCLENIVFNRITVTNAQDCAGDIWGSAKYITYQYCAFINSLHPQSHSHYPGGVEGQERRYISIHHNLYAYNHERQTNIRGNTWDYNFEQNIIHAWDPYAFSGGYGTMLRCRESGCPERLNFIGNYYTSSSATPTESLGQAIVFADSASTDQVYMQGNRFPSQESDRGTAASEFTRTTEAQVTIYSHGELTEMVLPYIGAPYRTPEEEDLFLEVAGEITESNPSTNSLAVTVTGSGSVDSDPSGIQCGQQCQYDFSSGVLVTLTATPDQGYAFEGWSGACSGSDSTCQLELTEDQVVTAAFSQGTIIQGDNIYVDQQLAQNCTGSYSIANRDCSGADGDAYTTPQQAADATGPGDTVYFREGTYTNPNTAARYPVLHILTSGDENAPITYMNYLDEEVILSGMGSGGDPYKYQAVLLGVQPSSQEEISGQGVQNIVIQGLVVEDATRMGLLIAGPANQQASAQNPTENIVIRRVVARNNAGGNATGRGIDSMGKVVNVLIELCEAYDNTGSGIGFGRIEKNWHLPEEEDDMSAAQYSVIRNNLIYNNIHPSYPGNTDGMGGSHMYKCTLENNVVFGNSDDGIDIYASIEVTVRSNIVFGHSYEGGNNAGIKFSAGGGGRHLLVKNIVFDNDGYAFEGSSPTNRFRTYYPSKLYHNLAHNGGSFGYSIGGNFTTASGFELFHLRNNIALDNAGQEISGEHASWTDSDYNFISDAAELVELKNDGFDLNSLTGDAQLGNPSLVIDTDFDPSWTVEEKLAYIRSQVKAAYCPEVGSNLIDNGTLIDGYHNSSPGDDTGEDGAVWYGSAPDIGVFEVAE